MFRFFAVGLIILICFTTTNSFATIFESIPDRVICSFKERTGRPSGHVVLYIDTKLDDGTVWYRSLGETSRMVVLTAEGKIESANRVFQLHNCKKM